MAQFRAFPVFKLAIGTLVDNFGTAVSICWPWMAIILGMLGIILFMHPELTPQFTGDEAEYAQLSASAWTAMGAYYAVWWVANFSMAVNWHRFLLRDDIPEGWEYLRLDVKVWRYVGNHLLIALIGILVMLAVAALAGIAFWAMYFDDVPGNDKEWNVVFAVMLLAVLPVAVFAVIVMMRLGIKLPAVAVGYDYGLADAWRDSRGNNLRLLGFLSLLFLPSTVLGIVYLFVEFVLAFFMGAESPLGTALGVLISAALNWIGAMVMLTAMTLLYAVFGNGAEVT